MHAIVGSAFDEVGYPGTGNHGLGGCTAFIDTGTAHMLSFNKRCFPSSLR